MPDGTWLAADSDVFQRAPSRRDPRESVRLVVGPASVAATPWEASAAVYEALGDDLPVEWETLPWTTRRIAHGIVEGVTHILGASLEARRAIDAAVYAEEMRELGVSWFMALEPEDRAGLAASAAEFLLGFRSQPDRRNAERALKWARVAASGLPGYGAALRLIPAALAAGYPERRRAQRLMDRARCALVKANMANDIAPDSR